MQAFAVVALVGIVGIFVYYAFAKPAAQGIQENIWEIIGGIFFFGWLIGALVTIGCLIAYATGNKSPELNKVFAISLVGTVISFFINVAAEKGR